MVSGVIHLQRASGITLGTTGNCMNDIRPPFLASTLYGWIFTVSTCGIDGQIRGGHIIVHRWHPTPGKHSKRDMFLLGVLALESGIVGQSHADAKCRASGPPL
jgi:hypothetical protein